MPVLGFILQLTSAQCRGEVVPESVEPVVGHLQNAADVGRLLLVQKQGCLRRVAVDPVLPLEKPEGHEGVQKVTGSPWMKPHASGQGGQVFRVLGKFSEELHLHCAEECLGCPEGHTYLQNPVRGEWFH